jgi:HemY protein
MKSVFGFLFVAAVAVLLAMLMGDNAATVTLFWPPYRVDVSFNLALFGLLAVFVLLYLALRGMALLRRLPEQARRWRVHQMERAVYTSVVDALAYQLAGRFVRAQGAAQQAVDLLAGWGSDALPAHARLSVLARWLAAESAHALGNPEQRDQQLQAALSAGQSPEAAAAREGLLLRAGAMALDARDSTAARQWLNELPQGAARRIQAVRLRLKLAQFDRDTASALEMVRLLTKHKAVSADVGAALLRGLLLDALSSAHDRGPLLDVWRGLSADEKRNPELALVFLERWRALAEATQPAAALDKAERKLLQDALGAAWKGYAGLSENKRRRLILQVESELPGLDDTWVATIEAAQRAQPADAGLQYLAGQAFLQRQLWGKALQMLNLASKGLSDAELRRRCWRELARLAESRGDAVAAQDAWKQAALC